MKKIIIYAVITLALNGPFFLTSCKKEEPIKAKTKTELLCASSWKMYEFTINPGVDVGGTVVTDLFALLAPCLQDDTYRYNNNGTGLHDEGPTKCDASDPQSTPITWTFNPSETQLIENNLNDDPSDIVQLDDKILKISQIKDGVDVGGIEGIKYKVSSSWKH
jgi:hypothetical protein